MIIRPISIVNHYYTAIADYSKAIELNPDDDYAYQSRVTVYVIKGDEVRTVADFEKSERSL